MPDGSRPALGFAFFRSPMLRLSSKHRRQVALGTAAALVVALASLAPRIAEAGSPLAAMSGGFQVVAVLTVLACVGWVLTALRMKRAAVSERRKFATLLDAAPEVVIGVDDQGLIKFANAHVSELFGYEQAELTGAPLETLIPERFRSSHVDARARYARQPRRRPMGSGMSLVALKRDGTEVPVEISLSRLDTREGPIVLCIVRDVTEQAHARKSLLEANSKLRSSLAETRRRAGELRELRRMAEYFQCCVSESEVHEVMTRSISRLLPDTFGGLYLLNASRNLVERVRHWGPEGCAIPATFEPHECWALRRARAHGAWGDRAAARCAHLGGDGTALCIPMAAHGETIGVLMTRTAVGARDIRRAERQVLRAVAEQGAIAIASVRLREALRMQSTRDALTGLFNRRFLDECLEREVSRSLRAGVELSLLMIDLDHFKRFNDTFGHQAADHALREVAVVVSRTVRRSDFVCRFGGEELVVLLPATHTAQAIIVAEKIRAEAERLVIRYNDRMLGDLTLSIGAATCPEHASTPAGLLQASDLALYKSKHGGRNRVSVAESSSEPAAGGDSPARSDSSPEPVPQIRSA